MTRTKISDLTDEEISAALTYQRGLKQKREQKTIFVTTACEFCRKYKPMKTGQRFCSAACRAKASQKRMMLDYERLRALETIWESERALLESELNILREDIAKLTGLDRL